MKQEGPVKGGEKKKIIVFFFFSRAIEYNLTTVLSTGATGFSFALVTISDHLLVLIYIHRHAYTIQPDFKKQVASLKTVMRLGKEK